MEQEQGLGSAKDIQKQINKLKRKLIKAKSVEHTQIEVLIEYLKKKKKEAEK